MRWPDRDRAGRRCRAGGCSAMRGNWSVSPNYAHTWDGVAAPSFATHPWPRPDVAERWRPRSAANALEIQRVARPRPARRRSAACARLHSLEKADAGCPSRKARLPTHYVDRDRLQPCLRVRRQGPGDRNARLAHAISIDETQIDELKGS